MNVLCSNYTCENGGTCIDVVTGGVACECIVGFEGDACEDGECHWMKLVSCSRFTHKTIFVM